ncbi:uncharacterized protein JCM6883_005941 [Sporobolomyces salmoneus]|uniref:uncharacterized protein n=1 Tax=Sporobolomyces salmoneus TaxID=183962 RepID=UPI0031722ED0
MSRRSTLRSASSTAASSPRGSYNNTQNSSDSTSPKSQLEVFSITVEGLVKSRLDSIGEIASEEGREGYSKELLGALTSSAADTAVSVGASGSTGSSVSRTLSTPPLLSSNRRRRWLRQEEAKRVREEKNQDRMKRKFGEAGNRVQVETSSPIGLPMSRNLQQGLNNSSKRRRVDPQQYRKIPYSPSHPSTVGETIDGDVLFIRTGSPQDFVRSAALRFVNRIRSLPHFAKACTKDETRGGHNSITFGEVHYTSTHKDYPELTKAVLSNPDLEGIVKHIDQVFTTHFRRIAHRYERAGEKSKLKSPFLKFPLLCINLPSPNGVDCCLHVDWKNPAAGVCAVIAYGEFDSSQHSWLILNELGIVLELPAGVTLLFPSSLIQHGNWHVVSAPTMAAARAGRGVERGSLVFYGQANWVTLAEFGMTMREMNEKKMDTRYHPFSEMFKRS